MGKVQTHTEVIFLIKEKVTEVKAKLKTFSKN